MTKKVTKTKEQVADVEKLSSGSLLEGTEAGKIWSEIKDREINMFALPNQKVNSYCKPVFVEPTKLYLLTTASSVLPALEETLNKEFVVELVDKYTVVSRKTQFPFLK